MGKVLYNSLKIFGLGYGAMLIKLKAQYRSFARNFHPDKHPPYRKQTGKTDAEAQQFFQLINNAHQYLQTKL